MSRHEPSADRPAEPAGEPLDPRIEPAAETIAAPPPAESAAGPSPRVPPRATRLTLPPGARRPALLATVAVVLTALVAGLFAWGSRPTADGLAGASNRPTGSAATGSDGPSPTSGPVESYQPIPGSSVTPVARLTAKGANGPVVPLDAAFRIESTTDTPAATLIERLTVEPMVAFTSIADPGGQAADLTPSTPLVAGTVYRFSLHGTTGELLDSWAFQAKQPLRIVGTLPGDREDGVPLDTGIEITFDQDGVVDAASHVSLSPETPGRFEEHGRTLAFVPSQPLKAATVYTVTVTSGIAVASSDEATIADTRFSFETRAASDENPPLTLEFPSALTESPTADRPIVGMWVVGGDLETRPATVAASVYRLAGLDAAVTAFRSLRARPTWTRYSAEGLVDTTGLTRVVNGDLPLRTVENAFWVELPDPLPAGWYLVQLRAGTRPTQVVLEVSDVAGFLAVSDTKTVVWANDVRTGKPIVGASATVGRAVLGESDVHGLISATSPAALLPATGSTCSSPCDPVVTLTAPDGRSIFLPASTGSDQLFDAGESYSWDGDPGFWSILHTDRSRYRVGDTVNVWGMARNRNDGTIPSEITVRLKAYDDEGNGSTPALLTRTARTQATGAFTASLTLADLPAGDYVLSVAVGATTIRTTSFAVGSIAKPAYTLSVATGRRVYLAQNRIGITVTARFYEGTPVPGVPLRIDGFSERTAMTDENGTATSSMIATVDGSQDGPGTQDIEATPARAEEAEIAGASDTVIVFPSSRTIDTSATIANGQVKTRGSVHLVAVSRLERALADGASIWDLDPRGAAIANAAVRVTFVELIPRRTAVGTEYDFVEKKVVVRYETELVERTVKTLSVRTAADGTWSASIPASDTDHDYRIVASSADAEGRVAGSNAYADRTVVGPEPGSSYPTLELSTGDPDGTATFGIGDRIDVTMTDPSVTQTSGDGTTYLFFTAQRGIHTATVQASRRYSLALPAWAVPNLQIGAVRFTGRTYVGVSWYTAQFRVSDRRLDVELTANASRYAPGQTATVSVRTRDADGRPVPATVVLRAVDEKLFTIGAAAADDPLGELYASVGDGIRTTYLSHQHPRGSPEGGDTTGGGGDERDDFRDSLLFETITTDADGRGQVRVPLSDDLTSWRVTGSAITRDLQAGVATVLLPVGLPFFVDASIAAEYLAADRPSIPVRAFGSGLAKGQAVTIRVTSSTLGFDSGPVSSTAFATVDVPLPALREGAQTLTISATTGSGDARRSDSMTRSFAVTRTRLTAQRSASAELPLSGPLAGGATGFTDIVVSDAGASRYDALLDELAAGGGARLDRALAADLARDLLAGRAGDAGEAVPDGPSFDPDRYMALDDGLALVPYSSSDLELSALVAIVAPDRINRMKLAYYLTTVRTNPDETRERRSFALAGLAGLGESVLPALRTELAVTGLTIRERLFLGLGAAALGDDATARGILAALVSANGEGAGQLARLRVGSSAADITEATALASVLAAETGDPLAPRFWAYVEANPAVDRIEVLPAVAFVTAMLDHLAARPASFAWTLAGERHEVTLERGESFRMLVTPEQLATLRLDPVTGSTAVTTSWREPVEATALPVDPDMTIVRSVHPPTATITSADLVVVDLDVAFGAQAAAGCREVTELVPSGLAPVGGTGRWYDPESGDDPPDASLVLPYDQEGSRVSFCVGPQTDRRTFTLRYVARVVTPGTYAWEPAIMQSGSGRGPAAVTSAGTLTIE